MGNSFYNQSELESLGLKKLGKNVLLSRKTSIYSSGKISTGDNSRIDDFTILSGEITIGQYIHISAFCGLFAGRQVIEVQDFCTISSRVSIYAESDDFSGKFLTNPTVGTEFRNLLSGNVVLESHSIIGSGSVIMPNVTLRKGSAVGAMSLVKESTEEFYIYAGTPLKKIKARETNLLKLEQHLKI